MNNNTIYYNGLILDGNESIIKAKDQGILFGYGLFETIRIYNSIPFMLDEHLERLKNSSYKLEILINDFEELKNKIDMFLKEINIINGVLRITVIKGIDTPNILFTTREVTYNDENYVNGFKLKVSKIKRNQSSPLAYIKTINYLDNILAKKEAIQSGYDDALLINTDNYVSECSGSNIFCIKNSIIYTPSIECGLLNGIVRELLVSKIIEKLGYKIIEGKYSIDFLNSADEVFITNSVMEIMPVVLIENNKIGNGKQGEITKKISDFYRKYIL